MKDGQQGQKVDQSLNNIRNNVEFSMKRYLISGLVDKYRIKLNLFAIPPNSAISVFKQKYPTAEDVYVIQDLFKN